jgi:hypothetical protein
MKFFFNTGTQQVYMLHTLPSIHTAISSYVQWVHTYSLEIFLLNYHVCTYFISQNTFYLSSVCLLLLKTQSGICVYDYIAERLNVFHDLHLFRIHATLVLFFFLKSYCFQTVI